MTFPPRFSSSLAARLLLSSCFLFRLAPRRHRLSSLCASVNTVFSSSRFRRSPPIMPPLYSLLTTVAGDYPLSSPVTSSSDSVAISPLRCRHFLAAVRHDLLFVLRLSGAQFLLNRPCLRSSNHPYCIVHQSFHIPCIGLIWSCSYPSTHIVHQDIAFAKIIGVRPMRIWQ